MKPTPHQCLDCSTLNALVVKQYYDQGIWLLLPFDKYEPFIRWVRNGIDPIAMDHDPEFIEQGVMIKKRINTNNHD
jgi:hypothetical protein